MSDSLVDSLWELTSAQTGVDPIRLKEIVEKLDLEGTDARTRELYWASRRALSGLSTSETPFPSLSTRMKTPLKKSTIEQYLREMGVRLQESTPLIIGGSSALILQDLLSRHTEDVDVVDEVPAKNHYLPDGWDQRLHSRGSYGRLEVFLVDPVDIFVGKLFSRREKDLDDLRVLGPILDRAAIDSRICSSTSLLSDEARRELAGDNYYIVFGDQLPTFLD